MIEHSAMTSSTLSAKEPGIDGSKEQQRVFVAAAMYKEVERSWRKRRFSSCAKYAVL
jgi:hypothetical protein